MEKHQNKKFLFQEIEGELLKLPLPLQLIEGEEKGDANIIKAGISSFYNDPLRRYRQSLKPISKYNL